jgi:hypothetical protein
MSNRMLIAQCLLSTALVTTLCILATSESDLTVLKTDPYAFNADNLAGKQREIDVGPEDPVNAAKCWENHGNFYYRGEYVCIIMDT